MKIRIESDSTQFHSCKVWLDDVEQTELTAVWFTHVVHNKPQLRLARFAMENGRHVIEDGDLKRITETINE